MPSQLESPPSTAPATRHDRLIERQLAQTTGRVRWLDWLQTTLILLAGLLAYAVAVPLLDMWLDLTLVARRLAFGAFALMALGFLAWKLRTLVFLHVNPYYAARQLEKTVPNAKGSVVSWLDLHEEPLPGAIRTSLSAKAAQDLEHADLDRAVTSTSPYYLMAAVAVLFVPFVLLFASGPGQFLSLLGRAFMPFQEAAVAHRTEIELLEPRGGNAVTSGQQAMLFRIALKGRVPGINQSDSPKIWYRYTKNDVFVAKSLLPNEDGEWTVTLAGDQIPASGISYKISAGDDETPEYKIDVQSAPMVTKYAVSYEPRPYRPWAKRGPLDSLTAHIEEYEGTIVSVEIAANRDLESAQLRLDYHDQDKDVAHGQPVAGDAKSMRFQFKLLKSGSFTVQFKSRQGEGNSATTAYPVIVHKDPAPKAELDPATPELLQIPANGVLPLKGLAEDFDVDRVSASAGIKELKVQLKVVKGEPEQMLQPKVYRQGKSLELKGKHFPRQLKYQDFVELAQLKDMGGKAFPAKEGMELEYWLEAVDICDFPKAGGQLAKSKIYRIIILAPEEQKKADDAKQKAEKNQASHDKEQDGNLNQASKDFEKEDQDNAAKGKNPGAKPGDGDSQSGPSKKEFDDIAPKLDDIAKEKNNQGKAKGDGSAQKKPSNDGPDPSPMNPPPGDKPSHDKKPGDTAPQDQANGKQPPKTPPDAGSDSGKGAGDKGPPQPDAKGSDGKDDAKNGGAGAAKKDEKAGGTDNKQGSAKDKQGTMGDAQAAQPKGPPPEGGPGQAKGDPGAGAPGNGNDPGKKPENPTQPPNGPPSNPKENPDFHKGAAKRPPPELPKDVKDSPGGKIKPEEVQKLEKQYKDGDAAKKKQALEELEQLGKTAMNPEVKDAANKTLNELKKGDSSTGGTPNNTGPKTDPKTDGPQGNGNSKTGGDKTNNQPPNDKGSGSPNDGGTKKGGSVNGDGKPTPADEKFLKNLSVLQLEQFKDKLEDYKKMLADPEVQKKLKLTPQEMEAAKKYINHMEEKIKQEILPAPGSNPGSIGSQGPTEIGSGGGKTPQVNIGNAAPPPEYDQAFKKLTSESNKK